MSQPTRRESELIEQLIKYSLPTADYDAQGPVAHQYFQPQALAVLRAARAELRQQWTDYKSRFKSAAD